jgi:FixJ family two-component response regulator
MSAGPQIAVVEDDESFRFVLVGLLRSLGYRACDHGSAEEFLASEEAAVARCVITDIHLPGMSGFALKDTLDARVSPPGVIMMTARLEEGLHAQTMACGALGLLRKPFEAELLVRHIESALEFRKAKRP